MNIREKLIEAVGEDCELIFMDGYDDCIVGLVTRIGLGPIVCYDRKAVVAKNMEDGMSEEDAEDCFSYNQFGTWAGEQTWCFLDCL